MSKADKLKKLLAEVEELKDQQDDDTSVEWELEKATKNGITIIPHELNTKALLSHYNIKCQYNEMSKELDIAIPHRSTHKDTELNAQLVIIQDLARQHGYSATVIRDHLMLIGNQNAHHPVRDWIESKQWDGVDRLGELLDTIDTPTPELTKKLLWRWLISGIAALYMPRGFRAQGVLTLVGKQGLGKTRWLTSLVPDPDWVKDGVVLDPRNKDSVLQAVSRWIVELGELDATFKKADIASLKAFITMEEDVLRQAYAQKADRYQRRTIFCASVNDSNFLQDTENRRYWVVETNTLNPNHTINIQQLWSQAYALWKANGEPHWLIAEEAEMLEHHNKEYEAVDPIVQKFDMVFINMKDVESKVSAEYFNATSLCEEIGLKHVTKRDANVLSSNLQQRGFHRRKNTKEFGVVRKSKYPTMKKRVVADGNIVDLMTSIVK